MPSKLVPFNSSFKTPWLMPSKLFPSNHLMKKVFFKEREYVGFLSSSGRLILHLKLLNCFLQSSFHWIVWCVEFSLKKENMWGSFLQVTSQNEFKRVMLYRCGPFLTFFMSCRHSQLHTKWLRSYLNPNWTQRLITRPKQ